MIFSAIHYFIILHVHQSLYNQYHNKMTKFRLLLTFYLSFAFASSIITLLCISLLYANAINIITILFWFKIITLVIIFFFIRSYKRKEMYYYLNLGISKKVLWTLVLALDMLIFILLAIVTIIIK